MGCNSSSSFFSPTRGRWRASLQRPRNAGDGLAVGILTGLVGVGGGFLIVPSLVVLGELPTRVAIGASLAVIALQSFPGFFKDLSVLNEANLQVDWTTIGAFVLVGVTATLFGRDVVKLSCARASCVRALQSSSS